MNDTTDSERQQQGRAMPKKKWIISSPDVPNPLKGKNGKGDSAAVYSEADLTRRLDAAKEAGVTVDVRETTE